jgi:ABC-type uncharacterized transport system substrate-binding protein
MGQTMSELTFRSVIQRMLAIGLAIAMTGCSWIQPQTQSQPQTRAAPTIKVSPLPEAAPSVRTAILVSDDAADYQLVADEITRRIPAANYKIFHLQGPDYNAPDFLEKLDAYAPDQIVAVGLLAARTARLRPTMPLVFCRVYDYQGNDLISPNSIGVKLLPPFELQLAAWKALNPNLNRIGVIMGPQQKALATEITASALRHNVEVKTLIVRSDQEALYEFKRLVPAVEGIMILPDNRILSISVLEKLMAYGARHNQQLIVFNDRLLKYGALMSITSDHSDVADQIIDLMLSPRPGVMANSELVPLTSMNVAFNAGVANSLGLTATPEFRRFLQDD